MMKIAKYFFIIILMLQLSCHSQLDVSYYKTHHQELYKNNNKKDTIYIYFKNSKREKIIENYFNLCDKAYFFNFYDNNLYYKYPYYPENYFYTFLYSYKNKVIKKDKSFLKIIKNKTYTYKNFINKNNKEIALFFSYNRYKTVYLIDNKENKKGNIYLKKVEFSGNFPKIQ